MRKIFLLSALAFAASGTQASDFQIGLGYSTFNSTDTYSSGDYEDSVDAPLLSARYLFSNNFAIEGSYRFEESDECKDPNGDACANGGNIKVSGFDTNLLIGSNFERRDRIFFYAGIGYFSDEWVADYRNGKDDTISGFQVPIGLGYNFDRLSIEAQYTLRSSSPYEDSSLSITGSGDYFGNDMSVGLLSVKLAYTL